MERLTGVLSSVFYRLMGTSNSKSKSDTSFDEVSCDSGEINELADDSSSKQDNKDDELSTPKRQNLDLINNHTSNDTSAKSAKEEESFKCPLCKLNSSHQHVIRFNPQFGVNSYVDTLDDSNEYGTDKKIKVEDKLINHSSFSDQNMTSNDDDKNQVKHSHPVLDLNDSNSEKIIESAIEKNAIVDSTIEVVSKKSNFAEEETVTVEVELPQKNNIDPQIEPLMVGCEKEFFETLSEPNVEHCASKEDANVEVTSSATRHQCLECHKYFPSKCKLKEHIRSHTGERPFRCPYCSFAFMRRYHLNSHLKRHCKVKFGLNQHNNNYHRNQEENINERFVPLHPNGYSNSYALDYGEDNEQEEEWNLAGWHFTNRCMDCGQEFDQYRDLLIHIGTDHRGECPICAQCFSMELNHLDEHIRAHFGNNFNEIHSNEEYQTSYMKQPEINNDDDDDDIILVEEVRRTNNGNKETVILHENLRTLASESLETVLNPVNVNDPLEPKTKKLKLSLEESENRPFRCHQCSSAFKRKQTLQTHLRTHSDERPFQCAHCSHAFKHKFNLTSHIRSVHKMNPKFTSNSSLL